MTYASAKPWSTERPQTLLVCCSDGRYHPHLEEFALKRVSERPGLDAAGITRRQREDLAKARALLHERRPGLAVHRVYARVSAGRVLFDELDAG